MVTDNHYRWDFIQLSTDTKPTPATSPKVADGSTLYTSDDSKLYVWYKDQWYEKEATGGGGGTTYTAGDGIDITDDTISIDDTYVFTGTDGEEAGTSGLVPAPATTDAGKFLKADGTWDTAGGGGGGITTLTTADYNYPAGNVTGILPISLPAGIYKMTSGMKLWDNNQNNTPTSYDLATDCYLIVSSPDSNNDVYVLLLNIGNLQGGFLEGMKTLKVLKGRNGYYSTQYTVLFSQSVVNNLTSTSTVYPLSANQGKALKDLIDALDGRITALGG